MSGIVDAVRGDGRTGRVGLVSMLNDRMRDNESGMGAPFVLKGELGPPRFRRIFALYFVSITPRLSYVCITAYWPSSRSACQRGCQVCRKLFEVYEGRKSSSQVDGKGIRRRCTARRSRFNIFRERGEYVQVRNRRLVSFFVLQFQSLSRGSCAVSTRSY